MGKIYPKGYIFLLLFSSGTLFADRIDQFYQLRSGMEKYLELLQKNIGDNALSTLHLDCYDNAQIGIKSTSEFVTGCITSSMSMAGKSTPTAKVNGILQLIVATFALLRGFGEIFYNKKEQKEWLSSLDYSDIVLKFPHIILIEFQIKVMKLLIEMNIDGSPAEVAFARIHLASMNLPGPYEFSSKRLSKKIYKKYFDKNGRLINLEFFDQPKMFQNFLKKVPDTWQELVLKVHKFPTRFHLFYDSFYKENIFSNEYNQKVLQLIEAGRLHDREAMDLLYLEKENSVFSTIYEFYIKQN